METEERVVVLTFRGKTENVDKMIASAEAYGAAVEVTTRKVKSYEDGLEKLARKNNALYAAEQQYAAERAKIERAVQTAIGKGTEHAEVLRLQTTALDGLIAKESQHIARLTAARDATVAMTTAQKTAAEQTARDAEAWSRLGIEIGRVGAFVQKAKADQAAFNAATTGARFTDALNRRLGIGGTSSNAAASGAAFIAAEKQAAAEAAAGMANLGRAVAEAARAQQAEAAASAAQRSELTALSAALDPTIAKTNFLVETRRKLQAATAAGHVTQAESARLMDLAHKSAERFDTSINRVGQSSKLSAYQMQNLSFQLNDVVQGLATGQPIMMVLGQQSFQIAQSVGGWGKALSLIFSPQGAMIAGGAAAVALFTAMIVRAEALEGVLRRIGALQAAQGGASGLSNANIQSVITRQAALPGFGRVETQDAAAALLGVRQIGGADFQKTLELARNFALLTGQELVPATKELASAFAAGADGVKRLDAAYNILTPDQVRLIESLERQGRAQDVVALGIDAMAARMRNGKQAIGPFRAFIEELGKDLDNLLTRLAKSDVAVAALGFLKYQLSPIAGAAALTAGPTEDAALRAARERQSVAQLNVDRLSTIRGGASSRDIANLDTAKKAVVDLEEKLLQSNISKWFADLAASGDRTAAAFQQSQKEAQALALSFLPLHQAEIAATDKMTALGDALRKAVDPTLIDLLTSALASATDAAAKAQRTIVDASIEGAADAGVAAGAGRLARPGLTAELAARRQWEAMGYEDKKRAITRFGGTEDEAMARFIAAERGKIDAGQGASRRDAMEDLDATTRNKLTMARAYGVSLQAAYREQARQAGAEAERTQGLDAGTVARQQSIQQGAQGLENLARQNQETRLSIGLAEKLAAADVEGARAVREVERANQVAQFAFDARARAAESGNAEIIAGVEREVDAYDALIKRQQKAQLIREAASLNRQYDPAVVYREESERLEDLARTGKVTAVAMREAQTDAFDRMARAGDSWTNGALAGLHAVERSARTTGAAIADALVSAFSSVEDAIARLVTGVAVDFRSLVSQIQQDVVRIAVRQHITGPLAGGISGLFGGGSAGGGVVGTDAGSWARGAGSITGSLGGGSGGFSLGGMNPFGMFGEGGSLRGWLSSPIGGFQAMPPGVFGPPAPATGLGATTWGQGIGAAAGFLGGAYQLSRGGAGNTVAGIGSMIGAGVSLIPGVGQVAGPIIGIASQILGGLLGGGKPDVKAQGWHTYNAASGLYGGRSTFSENIAAPVNSSIGNDALKIIKAFGGSVGEGRSAPEYYLWRGFDDGRMDATVTVANPLYAKYYDEARASGLGVDAGQWQARQKIWGSTPLPLGEMSTDFDKMQQQLAIMILKTGVLQGDFAGLSGTSQSIIKNYPDANTQGLAESLAWGKSTYDVLRRPEAMTSAEKAMTDLADSFTAAIAKAKELGLATDELATAQTKARNQIASDFQKSIGDQILGFNDPGALALRNLETEKANLLKEAAYFNEQYAAGLTTTLVNINDIETLYGLKRAAIVEQQLSGLDDFIKRLTYGDLSAVSSSATLSGSLATYQSTAAQAMAGDAGARGRFQSVAEEALRAQAGFGGTNKDYQAMVARVLADANMLSAQASGGAVSGGAAANDAAAVAIASMQAMMGAYMQKIDAYIARSEAA